MRTVIMKLFYIEDKFYLDAKSLGSLSSLWVSYKSGLRKIFLCDLVLFLYPLHARVYNLGQKVGDKLTKLSKMGFSMEWFTADFLQFFTKKYQNLAFGWTTGYSSSNPSISRIFWKFLNFLINVYQCINTITFKFVNNTCPYYLEKIFEFVPNCRIDTRNKFGKLKILFRKTKMGQRTISFVGPSPWNSLP